MTYPGPLPTPPRTPQRRRPVVPMVLAAVVVGAAVQVGVPVAVGTLVPDRTIPTWPGASPSAPTNRTPTASNRPAPIQTTGPVPMTDDLKRGVVLISGATNSAGVAGTGMVIRSSGEVITNYHVVRSTSKLTVTDALTGKKYDAKLVGRDATKDVALLKLEGAQGLDVVSFDRDQVALGDIVIAAGNANGQGFVSAHRGNILAMEQVIMVKGPTDNDPDERLTGLIETNAPGWPGDSGGPMFDAQNEVLGMTTAGSSAKTDEKRVYAIPIESAMAVVEQIRAGDESGSVVIGPKAFLGVTVKDSSGSLLVNSVGTGSPAAKAGLRVGDVITAVDGRAVLTRGDLSTVLDGYEPGATATLEWTTSSGRQRTGAVTFAASQFN